MPHAFYFKSTSRKWDALKIFQFSIAIDRQESIVIEFINDYCNREKRLDNNAWVKSISLIKSGTY